MLFLFTENNTLILEVNMSAPAPPAYRLVNRELLRTLMDRTYDGSKVSTRSLAEAAGCSHSTIGHLLSGFRPNVNAEIAQAIADRIGVGVLILFAPLTGAIADRPRVEAISA
jgi:transcriptional regulator with XRE-family HTH domain